jgi:hypothetical protein
MARQSARCGLWLALLPLALVPGCGSGGPEVVKVTGTVTRGGQPVGRLVVNFWPDHGRPSWGLTDAEGRYTLNYDKDRDGAVTGQHKVWVQKKPGSPKDEADMANGLVTLPPQINAIIEKYGDQKTTPLRVEVKENDQVIDLALD